MCIVEKNHVKRYPEGSHMEVKERGVRGNQPCQHLDLGLVTCKTGKKINFCFLSLPACSTVFCQP
jgi:hypothetical protein